MLASLTATITLAGTSRQISPDLFGIFFEDINYAADGGLYAEMVQNRSFEYSSLINNWTPLTAWTIIKEQEGDGRVNIRSGSSLNDGNPHYASVFVGKGAVGLRNEGYNGMVLKKGDAYDFSLFSSALSGRPGKITVRLESSEGEVLATASLEAPVFDWKKQEAVLTPSRDESHGRLVVLCSGSGATGLDMVSLFPRKTFMGRRNGLRADLAQVIADLKPKFVRFPGGCIVHGGWLGPTAYYDWKKTVGPVEQRSTLGNNWGYFQSMGLGYHEYFQFCEDIGAKPLPVLPAGVSCQNTDYNWGRGQEAVPLSQMSKWIQDALDLIEYANGSIKSKWGRLRAEAGHPEPFHLEYLAIGNEEAITPAFKERFKMIHDAVARKHPKMKVIGTVGPFAEGGDFEEGWRFARQEKLGCVDEHYYVSPDWFWENLHRYDRYDRSGPKVYAGEYAAHEKDKANTLRSALAEAAHLTSLERNGDVVSLASYAPLLSKKGSTQWTPDLIYFDNSSVFPSVNYEVQKLFMRNSGETLYEASLKTDSARLAISTVRDSKTGDFVLKAVSAANEPTSLTLDLGPLKLRLSEAQVTTLSGDPLSQNEFGRPRTVVPHTRKEDLSSRVLNLPPSSLTVVRIPSR